MGRASREIANATVTVNWKEAGLELASAVQWTSEGFIWPTFSGRGRSIYLVERNHLQIVDVRGGQAVDFGVLDGLFFYAHVNILVLNRQSSPRRTLRWGFCRCRRRCRWRSYLGGEAIAVKRRGAGNGKVVLSSAETVLSSRFAVIRSGLPSPLTVKPVSRESRDIPTPVEKIRSRGTLLSN
jgi:hypothetical protein